MFLDLVDSAGCLMHCIQRVTAGCELFLYYFIQGVCSHKSSVHIHIWNLVPGYFIYNRNLLAVPG